MYLLYIAFLVLVSAYFITKSNLVFDFVGPDCEHCPCHNSCNHCPSNESSSNDDNSNGDDSNSDNDNSSSDNSND